MTVNGGALVLAVVVTVTLYLEAYRPWRRWF